MIIVIIMGICILGCLTLGVFMLQGKGAGLISGYNMLSKEKKALYNEKALCRYTGWLLILVSICIALMTVGMQFYFSWLIWGSMVSLVVICFGGVFIGNAGIHLLKEDADAKLIAKLKKENKQMNSVFAVFSLIPLLIVGVLIFSGEREPRIHVLENQIQIEGIYGRRIPFESISNVILLEESMAEIGVGRRTAGHGGAQALRGNFTSGILFAQRDAAPTIRIERQQGPNIYISFRDSKRTEGLYDEISAALQ